LAVGGGWWVVGWGSWRWMVGVGFLVMGVRVWRWGMRAGLTGGCWMDTVRNWHSLM
jgi:hypothetical protein